MMFGDEFAEKLSSRRYLYAFFSVFLGNEPTVELAKATDGGLLFEAAALMASDERLMESLAVFSKAVSAQENDGGALVRDYRKLFVGPGPLAAMPWESVNVSASRLLFQEETLNVRQSYREWGYLPALYPKVADDHIALEAAFLEKLAERASDAYACGSKGDLLQVLRASRDFLTTHLGTWIGIYAGEVRDAMGDSPYAALADALAIMVEEDVLFLESFLQAKL